MNEQELETQITKLNNKIDYNNDQANVAYKDKNLQLEKKWDDQNKPLYEKRDKLRTELLKCYQEHNYKVTRNLPEDTECILSINVNPIWFDQPNIREISEYRDKIYIKMDGHDENRKTQQMKLYLSHITARELLEGLTQLNSLRVKN
mgnify:CR=1 FL=1